MKPPLRDLCPVSDLTPGTIIDYNMRDYKILDIKGNVARMQEVKGGVSCGATAITQNFCTGALATIVTSAPTTPTRLTEEEIRFLRPPVERR